MIQFQSLDPEVGGKRPNNRRRINDYNNTYNYVIIKTQHDYLYVHWDINDREKEQAPPLDPVQRIATGTNKSSSPSSSITTCTAKT